MRTRDLYNPNYEKDSILGIPNSILKHYGAPTHHNSLPILDEKLEKNYKNIILLVLDGMGMEMLGACKPHGFLMKHCAGSLSSVCPPTTTSALGSYETGLSPLEHGWLGWTMFFKEIDKSVELFTGYQSRTGKKAADYDIVGESIGFDNLFSQIKSVDSGIECCRVSPFGEYKAYTVEDICSHLKSLCAKAGRRYIYAYHNQPDYDAHANGCGSERVKSLISHFDECIKELSGSLSDTLLIVTADHGLVDIDEYMIEDFPDISECLRSVPTREARNISFFVKPECMEAFPDRWNKSFGGDFLLITADEAFDSGIFGTGRAHPRTREFLGDYVALATGYKRIWHKNAEGEAPGHKAAHGGLTKEEMMVPLILVEKK